MIYIYIYIHMYIYIYVYGNYQLYPIVTIVVSKKLKTCHLIWFPSGYVICLYLSGNYRLGHSQKVGIGET